jgi:hypothetical protein
MRWPVAGAGVKPGVGEREIEFDTLGELGVLETS